MAGLPYVISIADVRCQRSGDTLGSILVVIMKSTLLRIALVVSVLCIVSGCGGSDPDPRSGQDLVPGQDQNPNQDSNPAVSDLTPACEAELPSEPLLSDGYIQLQLCGWQVYMSENLYNDSLARAVYSALAEDIQQVESSIPARATEFLRSTNIWLELNDPVVPGAVYHPSAQWLADNGYPVKWAQGIQFGNAQNYLTWVSQQPAMLLHELSHALHHQYYNYAQPDLNAAYNAAMQSGIYESVEYIDGGLQQAYATNNEMEYFAELSEAYYWVNDFYPFNKTDLASFDPAGLATVELLWEMR